MKKQGYLSCSIARTLDLTNYFLMVSFNLFYSPLYYLVLSNWTLDKIQFQHFWPHVGTVCFYFITSGGHYCLLVPPVETLMNQWIQVGWALAVVCVSMCVCEISTFCVLFILVCFAPEILSYIKIFMFFSLVL